MNRITLRIVSLSLAVLLGVCLVRSSGITRTVPPTDRKPAAPRTVSASAKLPKGVTPQWMAKAKTAIFQTYRNIHAKPDGTLVANAKACRAEMDAGGMKLTPPSLSIPNPWMIRWKWCQVDGLTSAPPSLRREDKRAFVDAGEVHEVFENQPKGLAHSFKIDRKPSGVDGLTVRIPLETELRPSNPGNDGDRIVLADNNGRDVLQYSGLKAWDSTGRTLPASMRAEPQAILISVQDQEAIYPVMIDPVIENPADETILADDLMDPYPIEFGYCVANIGDANGDGFPEMAIGAPGWDNATGTDVGAVFVFGGGAYGGIPTWISTGPDQEGARFGHSVAGAGTVNAADALADMIVGAPGFDIPGTPDIEDAGAAYVYLGVAFTSPRPPGTPVWMGQIDAPFGTAPNYTLLGQAQAGAQFGFSVSTAGIVDPGNTNFDVIVGAPLYNNASNSNTGAAYLYLASTLAGGAPYTADWTSYGADQAEAQFGFSVCCVADQNADGESDVAVGAPYYDTEDNEDNEDAGAVYLFLSDGADLEATPSWYSYANDEPGAELGYCIASVDDVDGDTILDFAAGAPGEGDDAGAVYLFLNASVSLLPGNPAAQDWTDDGPAQAGARFGHSVSYAGDQGGGVGGATDDLADIVVGAPYFNDGALDDAGAIYLYFGDAVTGLDATFAWTISAGGGVNSQAGALFGFSVADVMDRDTVTPAVDDTHDLGFGAPNFDWGMSEMGVVFVCYDPPIGAPTTLPSLYLGIMDYQVEEFGFSIAGGYFNDDEYADVLVGAPSSSFIDDDGTITANVGRAYVFLGSDTGLSTTPSWSADGDREGGALFGWSVASGDVNGDGLDDAIIGARNINGAASGMAYVYLGADSDEGLELNFDWSDDGSGAAGAAFGFSVGASDVNGDGCWDVIVGAPYDNGTGVAYLYLGSSGGLSAAPDWSDDGLARPGALFGCSVAGAGNVNADTNSTTSLPVGDVIIGSPGLFTGRGQIFVYLGSEAANNLSANFGWTTNGSNQAGSNFGRSVDGAGDVNGDGYDDVIAGAPNYSAGGLSGRGAIYVYLADTTAPPLFVSPASLMTTGSASGMGLGDRVAGVGFVNDDGDDAIAAGSFGGMYAAIWYMDTSTGIWTLDSEETGTEFFGREVAGVGDVDNDGYSDVVVGNPFMWGSVFLYWGGE